MTSKKIFSFILLFLIFNQTIVISSSTETDDNYSTKLDQLYELGEGISKEIEKDPENPVYNNIFMKIFSSLHANLKMLLGITDKNRKAIINEEAFEGILIEDVPFFEKELPRDSVSEKLAQKILDNKELPNTFYVKLLGDRPDITLDGGEILIYFKKSSENTAKMAIYVCSLVEKESYMAIISMDVTFGENYSVESFTTKEMCSQKICIKPLEAVAYGESEEIRKQVEEDIFKYNISGGMPFQGSRENFSFIGVKEILNLPTYCYMKTKNYSNQEYPQDEEKLLEKRVICKLKDYDIPFYSYTEEIGAGKLHNIPLEVEINKPISDNVFENLGKIKGNADATWLIKKLTQLYKRFKILEMEMEEKERISNSKSK